MSSSLVESLQWLDLHYRNTDAGLCEGPLLTQLADAGLVIKLQCSDGRLAHRRIS
jgi:hypothetical protein